MSFDLSFSYFKSLKKNQMLFKTKPLLITMILSMHFMAAGWAQIVNIPGALNKVTLEEQDYGSIIGSPYFIDSFEKGQLVDKYGKMYDAFLKYDTYSEEIEILQEDKVLLINKSLYPSFVLDYIDDGTNSHKRLVFKRDFGIPGLPNNKYHLLLKEGEKYKLLKSVRTTINKSGDPGYAGQAVPDRFERKERYYAYIENSNIKELEINKKSLVSNFDKKDVLKNYIKKNKPKLRNETDLINLFERLERDRVLDDL